VLLLLFAHAFLAGATHFHRAAGPDLTGAAAALGRQEEGSQAPLANGEEQCLVCRLQRNYASGLVRHAAPEVAPPASGLAGFVPPGSFSARFVHTLSAKGRAPPLS
jgi:hypothetical protein